MFKKCNILDVNILKFLILDVLSLVFCRFPNFCVGMLTRDSVQQVFYLNLINLVGSDGNFYNNCENYHQNLQDYYQYY